MNDTTTKAAPNITLSNCSSSQIHAYGFDPATNTLALQFKRKDENGKRVGGSVYHYSNVPQALYDAFCACDSKGMFFGQRIKNNANKYPYRKIG